MENDDELLAAVGKRVRELRLQKGMTMAKLAEAADLSNQFLSEIERGQKSMTVPKLRSLALVLDVSTDYLVFGRRGGPQTPESAAAEIIRIMEEMSPLERELALMLMERIAPMFRAMNPDRE